MIACDATYHQAINTFHLLYRLIPAMNNGGNDAKLKEDPELGKLIDRTVSVRYDLVQHVVNLRTAPVYALPIH